MAIRNVFGAQSIRQKLLLGTLFLAIIPVAVTSIIVGRESLNSGRTALESQAREALIAQRASKAAQITDYFDSLSNQVQVLAASPDVVAAMRELPAAYDNSVLNIADLPGEHLHLVRERVEVVGDLRGLRGALGNEGFLGLRFECGATGVQRFASDDDGGDRHGDDGEEQCAEQQFLPDGLGAEDVANGHVSAHELIE